MLIPYVYMSEEQQSTYDHVLFRMEVHRALLRGNGFYDVLIPHFSDEAIVSLGNQTQMQNLHGHIRKLPWSNFLDIEDKEYAQCIVNQALPDDRERFRAYLSYRPLDLGLIVSVSSKYLLRSMISNSSV
ncbi:hypothetical protein SNK03_006149 [Fusarium graminearum]